MSPKDHRTVAVIGASEDRRKYGNKSVRSHLAQGWQVFPINPAGRTIEGLQAYPTLDALPIEQVDRVTMYVAPVIGMTLLESIARKQPAEVWLNPGAESDVLVARAEQLGLPIIQACSIVDLGVSPSQFTAH